MDFDTAIIGGGQAGVPLARALAEGGQQVALVERVHLGGSCVNFGCTPSKAFIASAGVAHQARHAGSWGVRVPDVTVDFAAVMDRARGIVADAVASLDSSLGHASNPRLFRAHGRLAGRDPDGRILVSAGDQTLRARNVVLDTGTRSLIPDIAGIDTVPLITAENWIDLDTLPRRLIVIGGSYLALEFGQAFSRLGSEVVILQNGSSLAGREDPDVSKAIHDVLVAGGIEVRLNVEIHRVERTAAGVRVHLDGTVLEGTDLLVATGRRPNTDDLGLDTLGVATTKHGMVEVDDRLATAVAGVWAAGDIRGGPAFTNTAYADSRVLESQLAGDGGHTAAGRVVPYAMFLDPELGRVGLTETEAREAGHAVRIGTKAMTTSGKAKEIGQTDGFIKVVVDAKTDRFLGAACFCHAGAEVVQIFTALIKTGGTVQDVEDAIAIHPTIGEAAKNAALASR